MEEIWKDIEGFEGHYQVSNTGKVRSIKFNKIKELKPYKETKRCGYMSVYLRLPGQKYTKKVHRLVAEAFIPNPNGFPEVNHIDENKENNCVENLEWCTGEYNLCYGTRLKRISESKKMKVAQYSLNGELLKVFNSQGEAAEKTNSTQGGISDCIRGRIKTHNGYVWKKYVENNE